MKTGIFPITVLSLLGLVAAQPHGRRGDYHRHHHRDVTSCTVYVDTNGTPLSTACAGSKPTPTPEPAPVIVAAGARPVNKGSSRSGIGITYSPYNADNTCKSKEQVASDIAGLAGYPVVRIYGTDCDQVSNVLSAARAHSIKLMLGIWDVNNVPYEADIIIKAVKGDWGLIDTVSVGNEVVQKGGVVGEVLNGIGQARAKLRGAGFNGPVVTVDTFISLINNPALCEASDYAAANCHAWFDGNVAAEDAGRFVADQARRVKAACGGKRTVITESGWPSSGADSGPKAKANAGTQAAAISSLRAHFNSDLYLFEAYNDLWKPAGVESSFGILN